jgi:AcrR family transcriptional regulator
MSRLSAERLDELYQSTLSLVAEHGYDNVTMDQIAEATHSSKATLYRQWGGKSALVVDALMCVSGDKQVLPDTGTLRGDLMAIVDQTQAKTQHDVELISAIMHAVRSDEELGHAVREQIIRPARDQIRGLVQRAVDRGEVATDCPALDFVDYLFISPVVLHSLLEGEESSPDFLRRYFDGALLPALGFH